MIIPRITTPAIFHTYGSMRSEASGWEAGSVVVAPEDIRYRKFRYQTSFFKGSVPKITHTSTHALKPPPR